MSKSTELPQRFTGEKKINKRIVSLGSIATSKGLQTGPFGSQLKADEYVETGVPVVMPKDISGGKIITDNIAYVSQEKANQLAKHRILPGDILFPRRGDLGRIGVATTENTGWLCGTGCLRARLKENVDINYIHQYVQLDSVKKWLERNALGQTMLNLNTEIIANLPVCIVSIPEQKAIASLLATWDAAIEKTDHLIRMRKIQLFGLYQRFLQPSSMFNTKWVSTKLDQLLQPRNERTVPTKSIPLFSLTIENGITPKTDRYNRDFLVSDINMKTYKVVYPGDIVFNPANLRWGAIARSNVIHQVTVSPIYEVLEINKDVIDPDFLIHALKCPRQIALFASKTEGTLIERMSIKLEAFLNTEIFYPLDKDLQTDIAFLFDAVQKEIAILRGIINKYKKQKRGLMQKLLTGQWRVKIRD